MLRARISSLTLIRCPGGPRDCLRASLLCAPGHRRAGTYAPPRERDGCPAPSGCARPAVKRVRIVRPSSLIEPGNRFVMPLRRTVVEPTPLAFGAAIFVRYASDFCLLAAAVRNGESVPRAAVSRCNKVRGQTAYSITSSARASREGGTVRPSALAVLRLMIISNRLARSTGRSAGRAPLRMRST